MPITTMFKMCSSSEGHALALYSTCHSPLSLFHVSEFKVDDVPYNSLQQYYQSEKADYFNDLATKFGILYEQSPRKQKQLGDSVEVQKIHAMDLTRAGEEWDTIKDEILLKGMEAKARQVNDTYDLLTSTKGALIAEAGIDGIGLHINDPRITESIKWAHDNRIGRMWMVVRYGLQSNELSGKDVSRMPNRCHNTRQYPTKNEV